MTTHCPHVLSNTPTGALRDDHVVIQRALALLERIGQRLEAGQPVDRAGLASLGEFFSVFADKCHHGKEEQHLFPALERRGVPTEGGPLGVMLEEHQQGRAFLRAMGQGNDRQTAEAIKGYVTLLRAHIEKENEVLFPLAEQILSDEEQRRLAAAFDAVEAHVGGPEVHARFEAELDRLERL